MRIRLVGLLALFVFTTAVVDAAGKHPTRYGYEKGFWKAHRLVVGTIKQIDARGNRERFVDIIVEESIPSSFYPGEVVEAHYVAPSYDDENSISAVHDGDRILALIRPQWGTAIIPNGEGEDFAMMPLGKPFYRLNGVADAAAQETMMLCRALTVDPIPDKLVAISAFLKTKPSARARAFLSQYLDTIVGQLSSDLHNAEALASSVKHE
jgi:hypothetical protein